MSIVSTEELIHIFNKKGLSRVMEATNKVEDGMPTTSFEMPATTSPTASSSHKQWRSLRKKMPKEK